MSSAETSKVDQAASCCSAARPQARVVLLKPGDVLLIGNAGALETDDLAGLDRLRDTLGLAFVGVFEADIDLAGLPDIPRTDTESDTAPGGGDPNPARLPDRRGGPSKVCQVQNSGHPRQPLRTVTPRGAS